MPDVARHVSHRHTFELYSLTTSYGIARNMHRQSHESTKFRRDGLPLSYGQITKSASADPNTNCSYESFRMGKSNAPDPCANCPYDRKVGAVSTKFRRCEGLTGRYLLQGNDARGRRGVGV